MRGFKLAQPEKTHWLRDGVPPVCFYGSSCAMLNNCIAASGMPREPVVAIGVDQQCPFRLEQFRTIAYQPAQHGNARIGLPRPLPSRSLLRHTARGKG